MTINQTPVIRATSQVLAHVPGLASLGSKPSRVLPKDPELAERFRSSLRSFEDAVRYGPHQAYVGRLHPRALPERPWIGGMPDVSDRGRSGMLVPEDLFWGLLAAIDEFDLVTLDNGAVDVVADRASELFFEQAVFKERLEHARGDAEAVASEAGALAISSRDGDLVAVIRSAHDEDEALSAGVLLDNLAAKATGSLALLHLMETESIDPMSIDYVIGCGEEAIGDRYQRGGGNLAKAIAGVTGLGNASGIDVKDFCAAPVPALVVAASLISAGVFERIAVVCGGSLAKLGMKFQGQLEAGLPVLEDVLGGAAIILEADDGESPRIRLDSVGKHRVKDGGSNPQILGSLVVDPLARLGLSMTDVQDYATELHNPEITEPQGSGNVPERNYKVIAALAVQQGDIERSEMAEFMLERGMPGFAPTQGHLASAICYLPHALDRLRKGEAERVMLLSKGSLFLGRMCPLSDGMSVVLERN